MGAQLADVFFVTRTWTGTRPGDGNFTDVEEKMNPLPEIRDYSHSLRLLESGSIKQGDLLLVGVSRNKYPEEAKLLTTTDSKNTEKYYRIGKHFYRTIFIKERLVTWDIQVRKVTVDERED
jgi:hypothetical protein